MTLRSKVIIAYIVSAITFSCSTDNEREFPEDNNVNTIGTATPNTQTYRLRAGGYSNCYLYQGNDSRCWGRYQYSALRTEEPKDVQIGDGFLCYLDQNDIASCSISRPDVGIEIPPYLKSKKALSLSAGVSSACLLDRNSRIECWGLGDIDQIPSIIKSSTIQLIAIGKEHICVTDSDKRISCWGSNEFGQSYPPISDAGKQYQAISAGADHTCGIDQFSNLRCWGAFHVGRTVTTKNFTAISSGLNHVCGIDNKQDLYCFGDNSLGQTTPPDGYLNYNFVAIASGQFHSCAQTSNNRTLCWGDNEYGQTEPGSLP